VKDTGPAVKPPPGTRSPEGGGGEKDAGRNPEVHPGTGMNIPQVARLEDRPSCGIGSSSGESADEGEGTLGGPPVVRESARFHLGYGSSGEESSEEGEGTLVGTDKEVSMGGEPVQGQEGTSVGGQSPDDDESGAVLEEHEGEIDNEGEEDGAVTVLKLSNGVMFRVPIEVQGMRLQAVVNTAAQATLVSGDFNKSLPPAPPIRREVVMNTARKGMQMNGFIAGPFQVVLGTHRFSMDIYVAPIEEDMLLGLDFLETNGVSLHHKERKLHIAGEVILMSWGAGSPLVNEKKTEVSLFRGVGYPLIQS